MSEAGRVCQPYVLPPLAESRRGAFAQGLGLPLRGLEYLLKRPRLWLLILIPLAINAILFTALIVWGFAEFSGSLSAWIEGREAWYWTALQIVAKLLFTLIVLVVIYFIFTPVALIVASPFNDKLAEHAERDCGLEMPEDDRPLVKALAGEALFAVVAEAKRLVLAIGVFFLILPLNLLPGVGQVASFYAACRFLALEFSSFPADRRHWGFRQKWRMLRDAYPLSLGYGLATALLMMIPFVNVMMVSTSAVAGAFLFALAQSAKPGEAVA